MPFELETLVGHLYIVNGRTIRTHPPGALVEVAPRTAARGRELDTYFALVLPSGKIAPNTFYEQMALMSAERYFSTTGSVTSALRTMLNTLNNNLFEHNISGRQPYEASIVCGVLRNNEIYLARVGSAVTVLRTDAQTQTLPEDISAEDALFQPPLGVQPIPTVTMKRYNVDTGTRLLLVDAGIAEVGRDRLEQALVASNLEQVIEDLKVCITRQTQMLIAEFVPPEAPVPLPEMVGQSTTEVAAQMAAVRSRNPESQTEETKPDEGKRRRTRRNNPLAPLGRGFGFLLRGIGQALGSLSTLFVKRFGRTLEEQRTPAQKRNAAILTSTAIGLPLLIVVVVVFAWAGGVGETAFEDCFAQTIEAAELARSIDSSQRQSVLAAWRGTLVILEDCQSLRPEDQTLETVRQEAEGVIDILSGITRLDAELVTAIPGATISRIMLQGLDLYALDDTNDIVHRIQLSPDGMSAIGTQLVINMRRGATVDTFQVGDIFDIGYNDQSDEIVALDRAGVLITCPPRFINECDGQRVANADNWGSPVAMQIWQGRLYVLDTSAPQLWRYEPSGPNYSSAPSGYFAGSFRPVTLNQAVDFSITTNVVRRGTVFVLYSDGTMTRHFGGEPENFIFTDFPEGQDLRQAGLQGMFLNDSPIDQAFYLVSRATRTIFETGLAGAYWASYRVHNESLFELLADVTVSPQQGIIYAASGNSIFALRKPE